MGKKEYIEIKKIVWHRVLITISFFIGAALIFGDVNYMKSVIIRVIGNELGIPLIGLSIVCLGLLGSGLIYFIYSIDGNYKKSERIYIKEENE